MLYSPVCIFHNGEINFLGELLFFAQVIFNPQHTLQNVAVFMYRLSSHHYEMLSAPHGLEAIQQLENHSKCKKEAGVHEG